MKILAFILLTQVWTTIYRVEPQPQYYIVYPQYYSLVPYQPIVEPVVIPQRPPLWRMGRSWERFWLGR